MKPLKLLPILLILINYSNGKITCKPADNGNGTVCISDDLSDPQMVASAVSGEMPPPNSNFSESQPH